MRFDDYEQLPPIAPWKPFWPGRLLEGVQGRPVAIVWHYTVGDLAPSLARLRTEISAHFVIDRNGTAYQIIDTKDAAWTQGVWPPEFERGHWINAQPLNENLWCVGVEIVNRGWAYRPGLGSRDPNAYEPYPDAQVAACVALRDRVCAAHAIPVDRLHQVGHEELDSRKQDPGPRFPWAIMTTGPVPAPPPEPLPDPWQAVRDLQEKFMIDLRAGADAVRLANRMRDRLAGHPDADWPDDLRPEGVRLNKHFSGRA